MARALLIFTLLAAPAWADPDPDPSRELPMSEPEKLERPAEEPPAAPIGDEAAIDAGVTSAELAPDPAAGSEEPESDVPVEGTAEDAPPSVADALADGGILYTQDLTDEELTRRWVEEPESLGSISVGVTEAGRLVNGVAFPEGDAWHVVDAKNAWGTQETIDFLIAAATAVRDEFAAAPPLRINHVGKQSGGFLRPHQSHQAGRDADLGFYYPPGEDPGRLTTKRELAMDLSLNWALLKALITRADVEFVLVDQRIQARLYAFALAQGEDKDWLERLFHAGSASLVKHARRHRDHFHVRFFSGRSQELGRRIQPLLAKQPEQNVVIYRVKNGDTLGGLATRYNSGVKLIQKANALTSSALRVGRTLNIPLRGPCTNCPVPRPLVVPARCLPPSLPPKS